MRLFSLLLCLSWGTVVRCAAGSEWCYTGCGNTPSHWGDMPGSSCGDKRQSPIDIVTSDVESDPRLLNFTFSNFSSRNVIESVVNNRHTVKFNLVANEVEVSGGGLNGTYSTIQLHFHWGDTKYHPGSEHKMDGKKFPMEMHIVSLKKGLTIQEALADPEGIAALGFFINATEDEDVSGPWGNLTSYLTDITDSKEDMKHSISLDDLIGNVDRTKFYRYMGSLTTPNCSEAVVWTVFQQPINIGKNLIQRFPNNTGLTNVFRPTQNLYKRKVYASPATPLPPKHHWCYDDHCGYGPTKWHLLPGSFCGSQRQSPINIEKKNVVVDEHLVAFNFKKFDYKHAIEHIVNTGHTVKCKFKEGVMEVSEGGLGHVYSLLQVHFHWGTTSDDSEGSEHTVDSHRYPMEMHIVTKMKDLDLKDALKTTNGLAVLAFFIEGKNATKSSSGSGHQEPHPTSNPTSHKDAWKKLAKYFSAIHNVGTEVEFTEELSIDDLIGEVNRGEYYRYNGSLTTPFCNEAVVWTVFKESLKVDKSLMMMFPTMAGYQKVFRPTQPINGRMVYSTKSASSVPGPVSLLLLLTLTFSM